MIDTSRPARRKTLAEQRNQRTSLADALFTTTQQRVLSLLFGQPSRSFFASELIELTGSGSGAVQRELQRLVSSGLVTVTRVGKQKHHQANSECPIFEELRDLVLKTVAMAEPIRQALEPLAHRIAMALVYGSVAKGTETATSDIDLLIVADEVMLARGHLLGACTRRNEVAPQVRPDRVYDEGIPRKESRRKRFPRARIRG